MVAANSRPQITIRPITAQKLSISPISSERSELSAAAAISADVRRWKSRRIRGAEMPPRICAPATIAATRPAIWYASGSP